MANTIEFMGNLKIKVDLSHLEEKCNNVIELVCQQMNMEYIGKRVCSNPKTKDVRSCFEIVKFHETYFSLQSYNEVEKEHIFAFKSLPEDANIETDYEPLSNYKYCIEYTKGNVVEKWYYKDEEAKTAIVVLNAYGNKAVLREI